MNMDRNKTIKALHVNCQSIVNTEKQILLQDIIEKNDINVISLNETFLNNSIDFNIKNFNCYRTDRTNGRGGGFAICVNQNIKSNMINHNFEELAGVMIQLDNQKNVAIFSYYCSPKAPLNIDIFNFIFHNHPNAILLGDLNARHKDWHCEYHNKKENNLKR